MSYLVLARKYRPQTFDEVVSQDHVTQTLKNAISANRVAHAMLFAGPRGTGKTTIARILAKAMNCQEGPTPVPCNTCKSCIDITAGKAADVFEIDGASNNSVDQIRELRDNVKYMPQLSHYKIYIIDEVHMLSISAFNALLKTLEEPPDHALFLFATTEVHKIPITILSRCQRHDLKRIHLSSITDHLAALCAKEDISVDRESLGLIAGEAGGCMRDALSLLDQVISCADGRLDYQKIVEVLGVIDRKHIFDLTRAIFNRDIPAFLSIIDGIYNRGHDLKRFYTRLTEHFRNLYVIKLGKGMASLVDVPAHEIDEISTLAQNMSDIYLSQILDLLFREESLVKFSSQPKLAIEMVGIKMLQMNPPLPIDTLIRKLDTLRSEFYASGSAEDIAPVQNKSTEVILPPFPPDKTTGTRGHGAETENPHHLGEHEKKGHSSGRRMASNPPSADRTAGNKPPERIWPELQRLICNKMPSLAGPLSNSRFSMQSDREVNIEVTAGSYNINLLNRKKSVLVDMINTYFGRTVKVHFKTNVAEEQAQKPEKKKADEMRKEAIRHPVIKDAIEVFNGKILDIKPL